MTLREDESNRTEIRALELGSGWLPEEGGGLNRYYYDLLSQLGGVNVNASGLVTGSPNVAAYSGGRVVAFAPSTAPVATRLWVQRRTVAHTLAAEKFDLVASHFAPYTWAALRPIEKLPLVVHFHGPWAGESRVEGASAFVCWMKARMERAVYQRANRLIVLSEAFAGVLHEEYGIPRELIRVVPGGVDTYRFRIEEQKYAARERLGWPADRTVVLCVRRLVRRMGLENLIAAAARVRELIPDVLFLIAGKGPLTDTLKKRIDESGLSGHVRLLGFIPDADLPLAYRAADLTVVPSIALEGFGLTTVESLAAGTPVVSTDVGGLREVIEPLSPNLLMADPRPAAMAEVMTAVIQRKVEVPGPERCREYASTFDWKIVTRRIRKVYDEALQ